MKFYSLGCFFLLCLFAAVGATGCKTPDPNSAGMHGNIKSQGVYTTLTIPDLGLDLPGSGYMQKDSFGPDETPAGVIIGYGTYDQQKLVTLKLVESSTGRSLLSQDYYASYGKVVMQPLAIRLSGDYDLTLMSGDIHLDTCHFTVTRTNLSGVLRIDGTTSGAPYAEGIFSVSVDPESLPDFFAPYNDKLNYWIVNALSNASGTTNAYLFAQRFPGRMVILCRLDCKGQISEPKIDENTLDDMCSELAIKAILNRSPYGPWPEDIHQKLGSDEHQIKVIIDFK